MDGFSCNEYKGFQTLADAESYMAESKQSVSLGTEEKDLDSELSGVWSFSAVKADSRNLVLLDSDSSDEVVSHLALTKLSV